MRLKSQFYTRPDIVANILQDILPESRLSEEKLEQRIAELEAEAAQLDAKLSAIEVSLAPARPALT